MLSSTGKQEQFTGAVSDGRREHFSFWSAEMEQSSPENLPGLKDAPTSGTS